MVSIPANAPQSAASSIKPCLGHLPVVKPCPQSCTGEMICLTFPTFTAVSFDLIFAAVSFDQLKTCHSNFFLFQPLSSNQQPAPSKIAVKRKSDNEVGTICETCDLFHINVYNLLMLVKHNFFWLSCEIFYEIFAFIKCEYFR